MEEGRGERERLTLVARKPCFGLPTACPNCLPAYIYLKFSKIPFSLEFNLIHPDSGMVLPFSNSICVSGYGIIIMISFFFFSFFLIALHGCDLSRVYNMILFVFLFRISDPDSNLNIL